MRNPTLSFSLLLLLASCPAHAESETAFLAGQTGSVPARGKAEIQVTPGEKVELDAGFFSLEEGTALEMLPDPQGGTYEWSIPCEENSSPCPKGELEIAGHGRVFEVPHGTHKAIHVLVNHRNAEGTSDAQAELLLQFFHPAASTTSRAAIVSSQAGAAPEVRRHEHSHHAEAFESPIEHSSGGKHHHGGATAARPGGFAASSGSSASGEPSPSKKRTKRGKRGSSAAAMDAAFDSYYSDYGSYDFSGGGGGPSTTARGYNRDSETAVLTCASVPSAGGGMKVVCEDETKELRVHSETPSPAPKKSLAKAEKKKPKRAKAHAPKRKQT